MIIDLTERTKTTSIIVTHLMDSAFHVATRMAMLYCGKTIEQGTPEHMRESKDPVLVHFLSGSAEGPILERSKYTCSLRPIRPDKAPREIPPSAKAPIATDYPARCFQRQETGSI